MRLILSILLFLSLQSQGQIIRANAFYRPPVSGCSYLLDQYSGAAAAYSLRKLDCDYSGALIRVRRSSDNTESDINADANGNLDTAALKTFVGTGGSDDGFIVTWYDQSGNGRDMGQSTAGNQMRIMDNGVVIRNDGRIAIQSHSTSYMVTSASNFSTLPSRADFLVFEQTTSVLSAGLLVFCPTSGNDYDNNNAQEIEVGDTPTRNAGVAGGSGIAYTIFANGSKTLFQLLSHNISTGSGELWQNGVSIGTDSHGSFSATNPGVLLLGGRYVGGSISASYRYIGYFHEVISYNFSQSSNRTSIESNINSYYSIY